jgi:hypothetical protein
VDNVGYGVWRGYPGLAVVDVLELAENSMANCRVERVGYGIGKIDTAE